MKNENFRKHFLFAGFFLVYDLSYPLFGLHCYFFPYMIQFMYCFSYAKISLF